MVSYDRSYFIDQRYGSAEEYLASFDGVWLRNTHAQFLHSIHRYALALVGSTAKGTALDVACGTGQFAYKLAGQGWTVHGLDSSDAAIQCFQDVSASLNPEVVSRVKLAVMDARAIGQLRQRVDVITLLDFVEHLSDEELAPVFTGGRQLLSRGGRIVIHTLPTRSYRAFGSIAVSLMSGRPLDYRTLEEQRTLAGHINLQSKLSLRRLLRRFFPDSQIKVWYYMTNAQHLLSRLSNAPILRTFLSPSLWATVQVPPAPGRTGDA